MLDLAVEEVSNSPSSISRLVGNFYQRAFSCLQPVVWPLCLFKVDLHLPLWLAGSAACYERG